jgi:hypothetical protein
MLRLAFEGSRFDGRTRISATRNGSHGTVVDVVDGTGSDDEVDVEVTTGVDEDVEVEVGAGVEDDVDVEVGLDVDDVDGAAVDVVVVELGVTEVEVSLVVEVVEVDEVVDVEAAGGVVVEGAVELVVEVETVVVSVLEVDVEVAAVVVVELVVVEDVGDVVVVEGGVTPPSMSPASITSATNVPRIAASKRFSVAVFVGAHSRATTDVLGLTRIPRTGGSWHVVVARGEAPPAAVPPALANMSGGEEPPRMLAALLPLAPTTIRRSSGDPPRLSCEFSRTVNVPATKSVLGEATITSPPSLATTSQNTYSPPPSSTRVPALTVRSPYNSGRERGWRASVHGHALLRVAFREGVRVLADGGCVEVGDQRRLRLGDVLARHGPAFVHRTLGDVGEECRARGGLLQADLVGRDDAVLRVQRERRDGSGDELTVRVVHSD